MYGIVFTLALKSVASPYIGFKFLVLFLDLRDDTLGNG